ncbi:MAG TPA: PadR family transcriptional regulator [Anaerolineae bacterium]|nr:PadR family transcriptional regulator [Anaerolineae bacterium]HIP73361.1 PadR family transcriptional regulator [Anaerolineae bacterium]
MSLQYALLGFLNYQPMTGYELKQTMDVSTSNFWHAKQSQIYTTLKKMEGAGLVISQVEAQDGRPDRRVYEITDYGRAQLHTWLAEPLTELQPHKELLLLKLFFAVPLDKQTLLTQLRLQRDLHQRQAAIYRNETKAILQKLADSNPELEKDILLWEATRRFGEMFEEMNINWLDETITMIEAKF